LSFLRANELREKPVTGQFDLQHLQAIYLRLCGDVYDWAGQLRLVEIQKGTTAFARQMVIERKRSRSTFSSTCKRAVFVRSGCPSL
jgi:cell filamentation protein